MAKKLFNLIIILIMLLPLNGCWDAREINKRAIVTAVVLDKKGDKYDFYLEIANTDSSGSNGNSNTGDAPKYRIIKGEGATLPKAREDLERQLDKPIYLSSIRTLILTENINGDDLVDYFNRLRENVDYRKKVMTVTTTEDPEELFKTLNDEGISVGFYAEDLILDIEREGQTFLRSTMRLIENISNVYSCFIVPRIGLNNKSLGLEGYAVVGGKHFIGFIPKVECHGLIYLKNPHAKWTYVLDYEGTEYTVLAELKSKKIKPKYANGKISYDMEFKINGNLMYYNKPVPDLAPPETLRKLEEILEDKIKMDINDAINTAKNIFNWDYLSFDDEFYISYPAIYRKLDWRREFSKININLNVHATIKAKSLRDYNHKAGE